MGETIVGAFTLPDKIVKVQFIKRKKGMAADVPDDHIISGGMLDTAVAKFVLPLNRTGGLVNPLTNAEKAYLEKVTGLNLSIYGDFWTNRSVTLYKQDSVLDLSNPMDYIQYAILRANKREIAEGWSNRDVRTSYRFVIVEEGEQLREKKKGYDYKKKAFKEYGKIENNPEMLIGVLKLIEKKPISEKSDLEWLQAKVEQHVDDNPKSFVEIITDPSFTTRLMVDKAVAKKVIIREGNQYSTTDGLELSEEGQIPTFNAAVAYLDNPKNQAVRDVIEARLNGGEPKAKITKKSK